MSSIESAAAVTANDAPDVRPPYWRRLVPALLVLLALCAALALWLSSELAEQRAIERMPDAERRALYERTLHTLSTTCDPGKRPAGLDDYCREQATFVLKFPECDAACKSVAQRHQPPPTR